MFTGIVREVGEIRLLKPLAGGSSRLTVACADILPELELGASVCVSGVCTTVATLLKDGFTADLSPETLDRTTVGSFKAGRPVNLEPSLRLETSIGGHLVAGHVDGVGQVTMWARSGSGIQAEWSAPDEVGRFLVEKGSVTVDGVSLTPYEVKGDRFRVSLIPETLEGTTLAGLRVGDRVNLEADILAKYAQRGSDPDRGVTMDLLARAGFLE